MAIDMFLKFNASDNIKGESVDAKHKDEIHIESVSWGVHNTGAGQTGGGLGASPARTRRSFTSFFKTRLLESKDDEDDVRAVSCGPSCVRFLA